MTAEQWLPAPGAKGRRFCRACARAHTAKSRARRREQSAPARAA